MKILLVCNAGMSSSILIKKVKDYAEQESFPIEIKAIASSELKNEVGRWDVCLVGPQLIYAVDSIQKQIGIPVASIEPRVYAMADGKAVYAFAKTLVA